MAGKEKKERLFSAYISKEVYDTMNYLAKRDEITKKVFVRRAIRYWLDTGYEVGRRLRITKRTDPDYVERSCMVTVWMEEELREQLVYAAREQQCSVSQAFFQAMLDYCTMLISQSMDDFNIRG